MAAEHRLIRAHGMAPLEVKAIFITWCSSQALRLLWASSLINGVTNYTFRRTAIKMNALISHIQTFCSQTFHVSALTGLWAPCWSPAGRGTETEVLTPMS